ncbi:MAG: ABC transporter permease [Patescibacteria group bacterium]|nr:ABC transporter permease [Patescibacteria group bacterium]MDE1945889.1 ABC transporter permease [Patescibacteria group bacterium]
MKLKYSTETAITGLATHKSRSALTILGVVIGITSIILVMSLGAGAQNLILDQVKGLGATTIIVLPGKISFGPSLASQTLNDSLKERDLALLETKENVPHARSVMPMVVGAGNAVYGDSVYQTTVFGSGAQVPDIFAITPDRGQFFTDDDVLSQSLVVVIGSKVKDHLFDGDDPIGQKIRIKNNTFRVIGVLPEQGASSEFDDSVFMPYTTAQQYILGTKFYNRLVVVVDSQDNLDSTVQDIKIALRNSHNITDPSEDDFSVTTQADIAKTLSTVTTALTAFLAAVAAISLVVGGIGIMNIMLVSVTERTREIGLRKALGATDGDILTQFLLEAVMLTATGGAIGITLGAVLSYVISIVLASVLKIDWQFVFPWSAAVLGIVVASLVGLVFGIYPARQAAKKSPMEALRYE